MLLAAACAFQVSTASLTTGVGSPASRRSASHQGDDSGRFVLPERYFRLGGLTDAVYFQGGGLQFTLWSPEELAKRRAEFDRQKEIARGNRAANPNFDDALDGWTVAVSGGGIVTPSVVDAADAATSGSVSFALPGTSTTSARQCVAASPGDVALGEARTRSDGVDAAGLRMLVTVRAYGDAQCTGTALGSGSSAEIASGSAGAWRRLAPAALALPTGSIAVALELRAETTGAPRTLRFDDAALVVAADALFANGLE